MLRPAAALLGGAVAVVVLAPTVALFLPALGLSTAAAPSVVATLLLVALLPAVELLFPPRAGAGGGPAAVVPGAAVGVAVACALVGLSVDRFDADHPVPTRLAYVLDTDRDQAWWVSTETDPGTWTAPYVQGGEPLPDDYPYLTDEVRDRSRRRGRPAGADGRGARRAGVGDRREFACP